MPAAIFTLSAFGDEIAEGLETQCRVLRELHIENLELRTAWGKSVHDLTDEEVTRLRELCADQGLAISGISSSVGKSPIGEPLRRELDALKRIFDIADALQTRFVRIFSFYPPEGGEPAAFADDSAARLGAFADLAVTAGITLLLENHRGVVGDTPERCHALLSAINSPALRFAWDPANFVQVGVAAQVERGWALLGAFTSCVHVKDARLTDGSLQLAGEGDGQVPELLAALKARGKPTYLALEPHLARADPSTGFSGPEGMARAATALRRLLDAVAGKA